MSEMKPPIDDVIEQALRNEPLQTVPPRLFGRIRARLVVAAMIEQERRQFRQSVAASGVVVLGVFAAGVCLAAAPELVERPLGDIPGALGLFDYAGSFSPCSLIRVAGLAVVAATIPIAQSIFVALFLNKTAE